MTTKTHLARQEEFVDEVGIQIRLDDPASPTKDQVWLNASESRLKARVNNLTRVYYDSFYTASSQVALDGIIDGNKCYNHFMELLAEQTFSFQNFLDGMVVRLLLENNQANSYRVQQVTLPASTVMTAGNYWKINSASNVTKYHVWYDFNGSGLNEPVVVDSTPVRVIMTAGRRERSTIKVKSANGNTSAGMAEYAKFFNHLNTEYFVWWNVESNGGLPQTTGTPIQVSITASNTAAQVASLTAQAINNADIGITATVSGDTVTIENDSNGAVTNISKSSVNMIDTVAVLVEGAAPNTANEIAQLTATALDALADFAATSSGATATITYADYGSCDPVENVDIASGFSSLVTAQGSGPVNVHFPDEVRFESTLQPNVVPPVKLRMYEFVKMGAQIIGTYREY